MFNVLIVPSVPAAGWMKSLLPLKSALELPLAGKLAADYILERVGVNEVMFTEMLDWDFSPALAARFSDLAVSGRAVFYMKGEGAVPGGLSGIEGQPTPLANTISDGLVVAWGPCVIGMPEKLSRWEAASAEELEKTPPGIYKRENGAWLKCTDKLSAVDGVKAWFDMNFNILHNPGKFTLPGYSAEKGVYLGRNVVLERGTLVKGPVLLQDNVWCARNVHLDGDVTIGAGSFIAEGAKLRNTMVLANTYIGKGLELENKIVCGNRIIDVEDGAWTDVEDSGVASYIGRVSAGDGFFKRIWRFVAGRSRGRRE